MPARASPEAVAGRRGSSPDSVVVVVLGVSGQRDCLRRARRWLGHGHPLRVRTVSPRRCDPSAATITLTLAGIVSTVAFAVVIIIAAVASGSPVAAVRSVLGAVVAATVVVFIQVSPRFHRVEPDSSA